MTLLISSPAKILSICAIASCAPLFIAAQPAQAGLSVSPQVVELNVKRGQTQGSLTMSNTDDNPVKTRSYAVPFTYDRDNGFQVLKDSPSDLTPYLQLYPANATLPGTDKRRLRFTTKLAPNLPDGEYRTMIFTEMEGIKLPEEKSGNAGEEVSVTTTILPRIGVAVYVRKGDLKPNLSVDSVRFDNAKQEPQILVKNAGKASAFTTATWTLKQGDREIQRGDVQLTTVLAETDRYLRVTLPDAAKAKLPAGQYELSGKVLWGFNQSKEIPYKFSFKVDAQVASSDSKK
jgi:P pilus assembly chaperone PapD